MPEMDEREKKHVGEQVEPGGRAKAPGRLALVQRFINTYNHDLPREYDRLGTAARAQAWLRETGLVPSHTRVSAAGVVQLRELREAFRGLVMANQAVPLGAPAGSTLRKAARTARLRVAFDDVGRTSLEADRPGVDAAVATLLGILHEAQLTGDWPRLKGCRQCGYAFFDRSKNRAATWCSMSICGNRAKNRTYRRREREFGGRD
jgi:predicted RNA-binding Zn ribbon-like protein